MSRSDGEQESKPKRPVEKIKVVIVDDEPMIRDVLAMLLVEDWGLDPAVFDNYADAEACIREGGAWVVFFDYLIRQGSGGQHFATTARSFFERIAPIMKERNGTAVLMAGGTMTASDDAFFTAQVREGNVVLLDKPWTRAEMGPQLAQAARRKAHGEVRRIREEQEKLRQLVLQRLFDAVADHPVPMTPEEAALEKRWRSRTAWKQLLQDDE